MPSQEFNQLLDFIKKLPDNSGLSMEERRAAMEANFSILPTAKGVTSEPVRIGQMQAEWIIPSEVKNGAVILYLHGGGYCLGSISTHRSMVSFLVKTAKAKALIIDYRLAPENPFPAAVEDSIAAYSWLLAQGISPNRLVISGDSAGGGLTVATLVALKQKGELLPAAAVCLSPWVDLETIGNSMKTKADADPIIKKKELLDMARAYLGTTDPRTPLASPLYSDLKELPPLLIQVGTAEILLDDATRLVERAKNAGLKVSLKSWENMIHVWQVFVGLEIPESKDAIDEIAKFIQQHTSDQKQS